jgi:serine/threonine protein kinase
VVTAWDFAFAHPSAWNRLDARTRAIYKINNDNVLRYLAGGISDQRFTFTIGEMDQPRWELGYASSPYAPHGTLRQVIKAHRREKAVIPEHFIWYVFTRLLGALVALGEEDILHLNISPKSILLGTDDLAYPAYKKPILSNFKYALVVPAQRRMNPLLIGESPAYIWPPPEITSDKLFDFAPETRDLSSATDIYSLGLVIREMMLCSTMTQEEMAVLKAAETRRILTT